MICLKIFMKTQLIERNICSLAIKLHIYKMFMRVLFLSFFLVGFIFCAQSQNYLRFTKSIDTIVETSPKGYIYVECNNTTIDTFRAYVILNQANTNMVSVTDFYFSNIPVVVPPGLQRDTFSFDIFDNEDYDPNKKISFKFTSLSNSAFASADSNLTVYVLNNDSFQISFIGAGKTVVESDTTIYIRVATNGYSDYPTSANVSLDAGSAINGKDFSFRDTLVTIPANSRDTILIPVKILNDTVITATREANFTLSNPTNGAQLNIRGFTLVIREDDLEPTAINDYYFEKVKVYPNPASDFIYLENIPLASTIQLFNLNGEIIKGASINNMVEKLLIHDLNPGIYILKINNDKHTKIYRVVVAN